MCKRTGAVLVIDTETTGTDPSVDYVVEVGGAVLDLGTRSVIWFGGGILPGIPLENQSSRVNGISPEMIAASSELPDPVDDIVARASYVDAIVAHNASFDRAMIGARFPAIPWICSMTELRFPKAGSSLRLNHLAADHGIWGSADHRAAEDVRTLVRLLCLIPDLQERMNVAIARAVEPKVWCAAIVPYQRRDLAKGAGFTWDPARKLWLRELTADERVAGYFEFAVRPV